MTIKTPVRFIAAAAMLAGCSNAAQPQPPILQMAATQATATNTLLYVTNPGSNSVKFYAYGTGVVGKLMGTITIGDPTGICSDKAGNVFIVSYSGHRVVEYAHGGTTSIGAIKLANGYPNACAIDSSSNDLALSVYTPNGKFYRGLVVQIFPDGKPPARKYNAEYGLAAVYFLAYDNKGNLFATAAPCGYYCIYGPSGGPPGLFELAAGGGEFNELSLGKTTLTDPVGLTWVNPTLLVVDANYQKTNGAAGLKVFINDSGATVVGTIPFADTKRAQGLAVRAGVALVADQGTNQVQNYAISNGALLSTRKDGTGSPLAIAISQSK